MIAFPPFQLIVSTSGDMRGERRQPGRVPHRRVDAPVDPSDVAARGASAAQLGTVWLTRPRPTTTRRICTGVKHVVHRTLTSQLQTQYDQTLLVGSFIRGNRLHRIPDHDAPNATNALGRPRGTIYERHADRVFPRTALRRGHLPENRPTGRYELTNRVGLMVGVYNHGDRRIEVLESNIIVTTNQSPTRVLRATEIEDSVIADSKWAMFQNAVDDALFQCA
jgi:hypothetical protein